MPSREKEEQELNELYEKQQAEGPQEMSAEKKAELNRKFQEEEMMKRRDQNIRRKKSTQGLPIV